MNKDDQKFWKAKLVAYLHDPPDKCFNIYLHEETALDYQADAGFTDPEELRSLSKRIKPADHYASAADRFGFPRGKCATTFDGQEGSSFIHPLSSEPYLTPKGLSQREQALHDTLKDVVGSIDAEDWRVKFFLYWRRWRENAITAKREDAEYLAFLPADTRIPDHSIWNHMAVTSAFAGCIEGDALKPSFLLFQLGNVQSFIAQARSTRDLWSGSFLLSWLMAHAMKAVTDEVGPDAVIFPNLRGNGIFDMLHRDEMFSGTFKHGDGRSMTLWERMLEEKRTPEKTLKNDEWEIDAASRWLLTPTLPNRFLALVPESRVTDLARAAEAAIHDELAAIGDAVWSWVEEAATEADTTADGWKDRWDAQIHAFPSVSWAVQPWLEPEECIEEFRKLPVNSSGDVTPLTRLQDILDLAEKWLPVEDRDQRYYADSSKTTLNNPGIFWSAHYALADARLAARRNTRDFDAWDDPLPEATVKDSLSGKEECIGDETFWNYISSHKKYGSLFTSSHCYGAMNLIKRLWCREDLVPYLREKTGLPSSEYTAALRFESVGEVACKNKGGIKRYNDGEPVPGNPYVAVLAMDGDEMGKWVSGEKTPKFLDQLSGPAREYLEPIIRSNAQRDVRRLLTPSYHIQFSEALSNFSTWLAAPVVEHFNGQLIYSGGDDVLAMVPAEAAFDCAHALRSVFRGDDHAISRDITAIQVLRPGYVRTAFDYPLVVPGPAADVSVGIAVGHYKSPLQMLVKEAMRAEKTAKNTYGRGALAVSLYKRSGEIIEWGCSWDNGDDKVALHLMRFVTELSQQSDENKPAPLSSRFPYAMAQLLEPYNLSEDTKTDMSDVMAKEFEHVLKHQGRGLGKETAGELRKLAETWMRQTAARPEDFVKLFLVETFINRHGGDD